MGTDIPKKLGQLADLHASGALSAEEFQRAKQRLLGLEVPAPTAEGEPRDLREVSAPPPGANAEGPRLGHGDQGPSAEQPNSSTSSDPPGPIGGDNDPTAGGAEGPAASRDAGENASRPPQTSETSQDRDPPDNHEPEDVTTHPNPPPQAAQSADTYREFLKGFDTHAELTCLECGYQGLMPVVRVDKSALESWWGWTLIILLMLAFAPVGFWLGIIVGVGAGLVLRQLRKPWLVCPHCRTEITPTKRL